jgi:predicted RNA-binding protein with PUA-like domain
MNYWLVKQEPSDYSWESFVKDGGTAWTGVRNFAARNHLRGMKTGDTVFFYHSGEDKMIVGVARVEKEAYPDKTAEEGDWSAVDLEPWKSLARPVTLKRIKENPALKDVALVRQSRLSVMPLTSQEFKEIARLGETKL